MYFYAVAGDGGNDVSMIQAADCGIGIEGKVQISDCCSERWHTLVLF